MNRFPLSRCASAVKSTRPVESISDAQPYDQPFSPSSNVPPDVTTVHRTAYAIEINRPYFASFGAPDASSWKRGSFRSGSNIGSSRSSAPENLPEIARQLGVAHILEGSVQKSADAVRVNVQL